MLQLNKIIVVYTQSETISSFNLFTIEKNGKYFLGVLKTKTPKTPKLENKDPPYFSELRNYDQLVANATES